MGDVDGSEIGERVAAAVANHMSWEQPEVERFPGIATEGQIAEFEAQTGLVMPPAFRYLQLHCPNVEIFGQFTPGGIGLEPARLIYLDGSVQGEYEWVRQFFFDPPHDPDALRDWLPSLVPFARIGGQSDVCLDFAFDPIDPPVVVISGEHGGSPSYRLVWYVAGSFLDYLEFEIGEGEDRETPEKFFDPVPHVKLRMVEWHEHRDRLMGSPPGWAPPLTRDDINA